MCNICKSVKYLSPHKSEMYRVEDKRGYLLEQLLLRVNNEKEEVLPGYRKA